QITGRIVALKLLIGFRTASTQSRQRFAREAELASQLDHPNTAAVLDAGEVNQTPYLAMRFVDGEPIHEHADAKKLDRSGRVALFLKACRGVEHAHAKGVIHRDVKPANILVGGDGEPVV